MRPVGPAALSAGPNGPPTPPVPAASAFARAYIPRPRSCGSTGAFIISPPPPWSVKELRTAGPLRSTGITPLRRYYGPIRHPLVVGRLPGAAGYTAYPASALSGRDEEGFSSCPVCPGRRAVANHPAGPPRRIDRFATGHAAFALTDAGSASGASPLSGPPRVHLRYGPNNSHLPHR